ncbi:MAG TPA: hypothetical protein DGT23_22445 [Micromonosporaceae bacterium]|nr:hypothetical protein [Micromonosporaceae bacterium]
MLPTIGRIVHYALNEWDADAINKRRADYSATCRDNGGPPPTGHVGHVGNSVAVGDYYPAMVVRTFGEGAVVANLQVFLDGNDCYWATSRGEGDAPGTWTWPPRVTA